MEFDRTGIILYVIKYEECVSFYENVLDLKLMFKTETLSCFYFGASYLIIEIDDELADERLNGKRIRSCLRMNVADVKAICSQLERHSIAYNYSENNWGIVAKFFDPDGNICAFKDSEKFEKQVEDAKG